MKKNLIVLLCLLLIPLTAKTQLIQKKYPGLADKPSDYLFIEKENAKIIPLHQYDSFLSQQVGIATKPANYILSNKDEVATYPYLIIPNFEYDSYMKKQVGYAGKPSNHIMINGKETIALSSSEINTNVSLYPGIVSKPAEHVYIDGQESIFVAKEKYLGFISQYPGVPNLPSNYVYIDKKIVVVIPINKEDTSDLHLPPFPLNVNTNSEKKIKSMPIENHDQQKSTINR